MFKAQNRPVWALCALLSIWICVIISNSTCRSEETSAASAGSDRPVLILDPGHGGTDGGAVSVTGVRESSINWQITDRIYDLARFMGLKTIRTRDREEIEYPPELKTISARKNGIPGNGQDSSMRRRTASCSASIRTITHLKSPGGYSSYTVMMI